MVTFSKRARNLWAKKSRDNELMWLPLPVHLADTAEVASLLWKYWVPDGVKKGIQSGISNPSEAERLFIFVSAIHDLGKATPVFATKESGYQELDEQIFEKVLNAGLLLEPQSYFGSHRKTPHALASHILLREAGAPESVAVILGSHHGKPPDLQMLSGGSRTYCENYYLNKDGKNDWQAVQRELIEYALDRSGFDNVTKLPEVNIAAQVLLCGLLIMADWISSDRSCFPYVHLDDHALLDSNQRAENAWTKLDFSNPWEVDSNVIIKDLYQLRFGYTANPIQQAVLQVVRDIRTPGIIVLEAPMGEGKTEAALVIAELLVDRTNRRGVFFALPTQATSDGMFPRIKEWISRLQTDQSKSIRLLHGKAQLNPAFQELANGTNINIDGDVNVYVHEWFTGRKRALLDDFVVGTIDQFLLASLQQKHVMLRHLGLANKVVIIDECHAYDAYMNCYLERTLNWMGAYGVPVIVLSATLPAEKRKDIIEAYCNKKFQIDPQRSMTNPLGKNNKRNRDHEKVQPEGSAHWVSNRTYPLITYSDGEEVRQIEVSSSDSKKIVKIEILSDEAIIDQLAELLSDGGCAGVVVNSVRRAQELTRKLTVRFGREVVQLLHSRFLLQDRLVREERLRSELGKPCEERRRPHLRIVVGTQVLEQSLDIDFDVLISDICPIDLLLQRIGRLHRHNRPRPPRLQQAFCLITGIQDHVFDPDATAIYGKYLLMRTMARIPKELLLPDQISELVQDVYDLQIPLMPYSNEYGDAETAYRDTLLKKRQKADVFRIKEPMGMKSMVSMLSTDVSDKSGEAAVRDTEDSIEVLLVQRKESGMTGFLPWIENGMQLNPGIEPDRKISQKLACCSVRLPVAVSGRDDNQLNQTIHQLEQFNRNELSTWQQSPWLKGELFLILDEQLSIIINKYRISYHSDYGLEYEEVEVKGNGNIKVS